MCRLLDCTNRNNINRNAMMQIKTLTPFAGFVDSRIGGRTENQDTCGYVDTPFGLLVVVCDGMGGGPGGKLASSLAVDVIIQVVRTYDPSASGAEVLQNAIKIANQTLCKKIQEKPALKGMGTTAAVLLINEYSAIVAHAGDSRIYQFRRGEKKYRTFDHSMVFELVKNGTLTEEQARLSTQSNVITRALGTCLDIEAEINELPYEKGDRFMLCTDGIWGMLQEKELVKIIAKTKSPGGAVESLVIQVDEKGFSNGGNHDNLTVALIETRSNSILKEKMSTRVKNIILALAIICCLSLIGNVIQFVSVPDVPVQQQENTNMEQLDSLVDARMKQERELLEKKFQQTTESLLKLIKDKKVDSAEQLLNENIAKQNIINKLDTLIGQLEELKVMVNGRAKDTEIKNTLAALKELIPGMQKYGITDKDLVFNNKDKVQDLLSYPIAKEKPDDKSKGHYNAIISVLTSVRNKISN